MIKENDEEIVKRMKEIGDRENRMDKEIFNDGSVKEKRRLQRYKNVVSIPTDDNWKNVIQ